MNHSPVPMLTIKKLGHALELFAQWERTRSFQPEFAKCSACRDAQGRAFFHPGTYR